MSTPSRLIRFIPKATSTSTSSTTPLIGEPVDSEQDVGLATHPSSLSKVQVHVFSGSSILTPGEKTGETVEVERVLSPLGKDEVGTIRCIGLNYYDHAKEVKLDIPTVPVLFMKPSSSLSDPYPAKSVIPKAFVADQAADYESELVVIIGKACKDVSEENALDYVLGFTAANDLSSRLKQFEQSQWNRSKGWDTACPIGPAVALIDSVGKTPADVEKLQIEGSYNGTRVQKSGMDDLIFSIPKIISFLSVGTTLEPGCIILTGTPAGVGWTSTPRIVLRDGDEFRVKVSHGVGTLITPIVEEK